MYWLPMKLNDGFHGFLQMNLRKLLLINEQCYVWEKHGDYTKLMEPWHPDKQYEAKLARCKLFSQFHNLSRVSDDGGMK